MSHRSRSLTFLCIGATLLSLGLSACFPASLRPRSSSGGSSGGSSGPTSSVLDLYVGQCIQDPGEGTVFDVENAVCTNEHWGEVFHVMQITSSQMPSEDDMDDMAWDACVDAFDAYVGRPYDESDLDFTWYVPSQESWAEGDRTIQCIAIRTDGDPLYQPVRNSGL